MFGMASFAFANGIEFKGTVDKGGAYGAGVCPGRVICG